MGRRLLLPACLLFAFALAACGDTPGNSTDSPDASVDGADAATDKPDASDNGPDASEEEPPECEAGATRACYAGPDGTAGTGFCKAGLQRCVDGDWSTDCEGEVLPVDGRCTAKEPEPCDGNPVNGCGGCTTLSGAVGESCGTCGTLACDGTDALKCAPPANTPGATCSEMGCTGVFVCRGDGSVVCEGAGLNVCGMCSGPKLEEHGDPCQTVDGCGGVQSCATDGLSLVCAGPAKNACGLCGGPALAGLGDACTAGGQAGTYKCNASGDGKECVATVASATDHVVISEIASEGPGGADDEFVELYNPTAQDVSIADYTLWWRGRNEVTGNFKALYTFPAGSTLKAKGFVLVAHASYAGTVTPDATFKASIAMGAQGGQVWLTDHSWKPADALAPGEQGVVDLVGFGASVVFEGTAAAPIHAKPQSIERKAVAGSTAASMSAGGADAKAGNGHDSDDNAGDFVLRATRDPQNRASATEP